VRNWLLLFAPTLNDSVGIQKLITPPPNRNPFTHLASTMWIPFHMHCGMSRHICRLMRDKQESAITVIKKQQQQQRQQQLLPK